MEVVHDADRLKHYLETNVNLNVKHPILIDKYLGGKELEVDAISDGTEVLIPGIMEHIERAGVHSGDSYAVYPGLNLSRDEVDQLVEYTTKIALSIGAVGLINIQYVIHAGKLYVIEVNPRGSRTVPFLSKATGVPMVKLATYAMLGHSLAEQGYHGGLWPRQPLVAVKAPVFSMAKLRGVEVHLGPEMKSTGEAMGIDREFAPALYKALQAAGMALPPQGGVLVSLANIDKPEGVEIVRKLARLGYPIYATEGTAVAIEKAGIPVQMVTKRIGHGSPDVIDVILDGTVKAVINTPGQAERQVLDGFQIRRAAVEKGIPCITSLDTANAVACAMERAADGYAVEPLPQYREGVPVG
jgi:carbamoyl-phosphate synthase large subunit